VPNVYVVNSSGHDLQPAELFGDLVIMSKGHVDKFQTTKMFRMVSRHLESSQATDYILHSGPAIMSVIACSYFSSLHGRLNLLIWRAEDRGGRYQERNIVFS